MKGLAEQLRARRERKGLSQRHLADLMGVHENTVAKLERNPERALFETIEKAAVALDIKTIYFLEPQCNVGSRSVGEV